MADTFPMPGDPRGESDLLSVVVPAFNEARAIVNVLEALRAALASLPCRTEVVVVDDASLDDTAARAESVAGTRVLRNPVNLGYGHSLMRGIAAARGGTIGIIDADGSYPAAAFAELHEMIRRGAHHAIGQRTGSRFQRLWSVRHLYRWLCQYVVGQRVPDANSGMRVFRREVVEGVWGDLCRGFSFTTSLTLASLMSGYVVTFTPITYQARIGRSHVRIHDALRTAQYLFQLIALYNPLKLFFPLSAATALLGVAGFAYGTFFHSQWGALAAVLLGATTFILLGLAGHAYVLTRTVVVLGKRPQ